MFFMLEDETLQQHVKRSTHLLAISPLLHRARCIRPPALDTAQQQPSLHGYR
jgi:hypothetical protein